MLCHILPKAIFVALIASSLCNGIRTNGQILQLCLGKPNESSRRFRRHILCCRIRARRWCMMQGCTIPPRKIMRVSVISCKKCAHSCRKLNKRFVFLQLRLLFPFKIDRIKGLQFTSQPVSIL